MTSTSRGVGQYRASEAHVALLDRMYKPNGTRRGIIWCHGAGHTADSDIATGSQADKLLALVAAGYPVISCDLSATTYAGYNFGNDDHIAAIAAAWTYLKSPFGAKTDKVGLYCGSMGVTGGLNWARQNLASVFAAALTIPLLDPNDAYQNDKGGLRAQIGTAYGVTFPAALPNQSTHCPVSYGASDLLNLPVKIWAASDDPIASNVTAATAWDGRGATLSSLVNLGAVGHDATTVSSSQVLAFFDANGGRS